MEEHGCAELGFGARLETGKSTEFGGAFGFKGLDLGTEEGTLLFHLCRKSAELEGSLDDRGLGDGLGG